MFDGLTKKEAKEIIFKYVEEYYNRYNKKDVPTSIPYASRVYDEKEMINLVDAALDFWLTSGKYTDKFESGFCDFIGTKYCSVVNSGSSANLLAFMALTSPKLGERRIKPGDEVITVACGFPTTVTPCIQYGAVPVFVDVTIPQYNIDVNALEEALSDKTKAIMIAHTLGNPFNIQKVKDFCIEHNIWLIEDNCDALGSKYLYNDEWYYTGTIGDIGTSSFYPPHHMTMGEGGAVYTNNETLHKIIRSLRDWGRDCCCPSGRDNCCGHRFEGKHGELPCGYDHKYVYSHFGYNLKATDLQTAIGCAQLDKIKDFITKRRENHEYLYSKLKDRCEDLILPEPLDNSKPSWFGFLITCKKPRMRDELVKELESKGVQTRMLFAGNLILHPCFDDIRKQSKGFRIIGNLDNTNHIMNNSFWVGVYPGMTKEKIDIISNIIISYLENKTN